MTSYRPALMVAALAVMLSACGGSNEDDNAPPVVPAPAPAPAPSATGDVPATALTTADAFTTFVGTLQNSATALPINVNGANPPKSETDLPKPI